MNSLLIAKPGKGPHFRTEDGTETGRPLANLSNRELQVGLTYLHTRQHLTGMCAWSEHDSSLRLHANVSGMLEVQACALLASEDV